MSDFGRFLIVFGAGLVGLGGLVLLASKIPFLGRLPGDIRVEREGWAFYFPIVTCLLLSAVLSFFVWLISKFR